MILVTGGTGFIGRHLVSALVRNGLRVRALVRDPARATLLPAEADVFVGDLLDAGSLETAVVGTHAIVHLGAQLQASTNGQDGLLAANDAGTRNLVDAALAASVDHFVYLSSAGVYGSRATPEPIPESAAVSPGNAYERTKLAGEEIVRAHARSWTVLRPGGVFGASRPHTAAFVRAVATRRVWLQAGPDTLLNPAYVHDVVGAILFALDRPDVRGEVINVGGPRVVSHRELVDVTAAALGRSARHIGIPAPLARVGAALVRVPFSLARRPVPERLGEIGAGVVNRAVSTEKARRLGIAMTPLERAMDETVAQLRAAGTGLPVT